MYTFTQLKERHLYILRSLLPSGEAWPREPESHLSKTLEPLAVDLAQAEDRAQDLTAEARPSTALETLEDWEADFGLPDQCSLTGETIEMRRQAVVLKRSDSGHSPSRYARMMERMGYENVEIEELRPFQAGVAQAGDRLLGADYAHVFIVHLPESAVYRFHAGTAQAGDSLGRFGDDRAECILNQVKAAHTLAVFAYGD